MKLAWRNLLQDKTRFGLSLGGVALAVMLILLLSGFLTGMYRQITAYLDHSPSSIVVSQEGVNNLLGVTSLLPAGTDDAARRVPGVSKVAPILSQFIILDLHGRKQPVYLIGYDPAFGGGPWRMAQGREPQTKDEMVFDRVLARRHNIELGDQVEMVGRRFTVVGLSEGTTSWMTSFVFIQKSAAEEMWRAPGAASHLLVTTDEGLAPSAVRDQLAELPGSDAQLKEEVMANDLRLFGRVFSAPLKLMVGIAFLVGTLVVGLVIFTATMERQREYGVLKAIGARPGRLYRVVAVQALIASIVGSALGIGLARGAAELIMAARPQFLVLYAPTAVAQALLAGLAMSMLAALLPARLIARLAPAEVFRR
jgi:putative ABC transport system permease protein